MPTSSLRRTCGGYGKGDECPAAYMSDDNRRQPPGNVKLRPLTLRCCGLRITTNDRQQPPVDALVWDGEHLLAGPFDRLDQAVAWIKARLPSAP